MCNCCHSHPPPLNPSAETGQESERTNPPFLGLYSLSGELRTQRRRNLEWKEIMKKHLRLLLSLARRELRFLVSPCAFFSYSSDCFFVHLITRRDRHRVFPSLFPSLAFSSSCSFVSSRNFPATAYFRCYGSDHLSKGTLKRWRPVSLLCPFLCLSLAPFFYLFQRWTPLYFTPSLCLLRSSGERISRDSSFLLRRSHRRDRKRMDGPTVKQFQ